MWNSKSSGFWANYVVFCVILAWVIMVLAPVMGGASRFTAIECRNLFEAVTLGAIYIRVKR